MSDSSLPTDDPLPLADPRKTRHPRIAPYPGPAGGWGALKSVGRHLLHNQSPLKGSRSLLATNQPEGFDCPGCAWGDPEHESSFEFCENGVKAVSWETTAKRVTRRFFAQHTVSEMRGWDDFRLEDQGRLTEPMRYDAASDRYQPIDWEDAFALIADHLAAIDPDRALFYTSGRASNEAAYLYQLFARVYGTNNLPDCSNMCHEASGLGMTASLGVGKGTVTLEDFEHADAILVFGQNPGTNHPRMLGDLRRAAERGAAILTFNPLRERGLERFADPQNALEMLSGGSHRISSHYFQPKLGGDMAAVRGIAKALFTMIDDGDYTPDRAFLDTLTEGLDAWRARVEATDWAHIEAQSGLSRDELARAATVYAHSRRVIATWAMGITQHVHSVDTVREIVNLLLLGGHVGREGAGLCPVRGHSNVQGNRTVGIDEKAPGWLIDALEARYGRPLPRRPGHNTVSAIAALERGDSDVFVALGGNFARATPDTPRTEAALGRTRLNVQISTKLNRSHLMIGEDALILPCLGRSEHDHQGPDGEIQAISVEDSMSMVHASRGRVAPASPALRSEPAIVAGIAEATLARTPSRETAAGQPLDWQNWVSDYDRIRAEIEAVIPGFEAFNARLRQPRGFALDNPARQRRFPTPSGKAMFSRAELPEAVMHQRLHERRDAGWLTLQTLRSHDQYNTTIYGYDDRYRGVHGQRRVLFINAGDLARLGLRDGDWVDLVGEPHQDRERRAAAFRLVSYAIPAGCCAAYYPETNPLVPLESVGIGTDTPTSKAVAIRLERSRRLA
ncbi:MULTISPECIES: FdhF/YdeP family oxidoreductase [unclassified Modicisalibacter]|uniref:FdhF/YdeP family oxidoreductase n=1 Tax=unclassified Modicisalibacter TaxID=2679913 RepID=UPI001CCDFBF1|nr:MULTISPECIES: FdhF/YdeP family oxidoreductase [unclassified Modicisalibacter]MBZ9558695.1 FdhF/YdeP family oxidoreductase [Modicisalibacter sp. R2A 31.J]MBZ9575413.1 FdhF/YdeP family oxidoreductase [Modicisalibacter sp. MOD 31.J]